MYHHEDWIIKIIDLTKITLRINLRKKKKKEFSNKILSYSSSVRK